MTAQILEMKQVKKEYDRQYRLDNKNDPTWAAKSKASAKKYKDRMRKNPEWRKKEAEAQIKRYHSDIKKYRTISLKSNLKRQKRKPEQCMLERARTRAKEKGWMFNLKIQDIIIPAVCPILGIKLERGEGVVCSNSPSLDRKENNKGYIRGNIQVISYKANTMKNSATKEELLSFSNWVYLNYGGVE